MKLKESVKNFLGVALFYIMIILGVVLINARLGQINGQTKSTTETSTQIVQTLNR